jgi:ABC-type transport system involved in cytochrome c biogenesis permease component
MTFLPIVDRELRVAARRRFTYWSRLSAATLALLIFAGLQIIFAYQGGISFKPGQIQFSIFKWLCFAFASAMGIFLTSDCLSEEKREGTLGLLFLTDLRGHDVVFGKLISNSIQTAYGLLATFPIVGLTLLVGGVAGAEFGRVLLVICNTLFVSLTIGLAVSSFSRETIKAMNGTLLICLIVMGGLPLADLALAGWDEAKFNPILSMASPAYLFVVTDGTYPKDYWFCLGVQNVLGWSFLLLSAICTPRSWQEKSRNSDNSRVSLSQLWQYGSARGRAERRKRLLDQDALLWLTQRDRRMTRGLWSLVILGLGLLFGSMLWRGDWEPLKAAHYVMSGLVWLLELWVAASACRFFVDAVRNGALELILVTPVTFKQIVRSHWTALLRTFLVPMLVILAVQLAAGFLAYLEIAKTFSGTGVSGSFNYATYQLVSMLAAIVVTVTNLIAVAWFGMWMGLTTKKPSIAVLKTIGFALVLPWLGLTFASGIFMVSFSLMNGPFWAAPILAAALAVAKNIIFITISRRKLFAAFPNTTNYSGQFTLSSAEMRALAVPQEKAAVPAVDRTFPAVEVEQGGVDKVV